MFFKKKTESTHERIARFLGKFGVRIIEDCWYFGFLMSDGSMILFSSIHSITENGEWITVDLMDSHHYEPLQKQSMRFIVAPTSRTTAVINTRHIMGIFETADT